MLQLVSLAALVASLLPFSTAADSTAADLKNWEGPHIDVKPNNRAIDWWYTQVVSQTPAPNGRPPSVEVVLKHGNTFQFKSDNTPLYPVEVHGFDLKGNPFAETIVFETSTVERSPSGGTVGTWGNKEAVFTASADRKTFTIAFNTAVLKGTIHIKSDASARTGCGGTALTDSPYFDSLVADGRKLTTAEEILYKKTGWRITIPSGPSTVDMVYKGTPIKFSGVGYKDSNWGPNAMNDFVKSWYVLIAQVGPWAFVTFSGTPTTGTNVINSAHLLHKGKYVISQCTILGSSSTKISIITPSGKATSSGVVAPTAFDVTFVLPENKNVSFHAANIAENPSVSVYHRWVAKYTGGAEGENFSGYGITEWMNAGKLSQWPVIG